MTKIIIYSLMNKYYISLYVAALQLSHRLYTSRWCCWVWKLKLMCLSVSAFFLMGSRGRHHRWQKVRLYKVLWKKEVTSYLIYDLNKQFMWVYDLSIFSLSRICFKGRDWKHANMSHVQSGSRCNNAPHSHPNMVTCGSKNHMVSAMRPNWKSQNHTN